jgi:putative ABC transport system ATP-binding protein
MIQFDRVTVAVRGKILLHNVSFFLNAGDKAVLVGRSGAGKSTILKSLLGLHRVTEGGIYFYGQPLNSTTIQTIRSSVAYIGQEPILGSDTVREALLLPFRFKIHRSHEPSESQLIEGLQALHLPASILDQPCAKISGGEKQRIALARALLLGKSLCLLDEVTSALDAESKKVVMENLADPKLTVLSVAHDAEWISRCGVILELDHGRLVKESRVGHA